MSSCTLTARVSGSIRHSIGTTLLTTTASPPGPRAKSGGQPYSAWTQLQEGRATFTIFSGVLTSWTNTPSLVSDHTRLRSGSFRERRTDDGAFRTSAVGCGAAGSTALAVHPPPAIQAASRAAVAACGSAAPGALGARVPSVP